MFFGPAGVAGDVGVGAHAVGGDADVGRAGFLTMIKSIFAVTFLSSYWR